MDWKSLFFSFRGRINRAKYWLALLMLIIAEIVLAGIRVIVEHGLEVVADSIAGLVVLFVVSLAVLAVGLALLVTGLAVAAKRLHDRDKSAWWLLIFYLLPGVLATIGTGVSMATDSWFAVGLFGAVALAISIWAFIELGCLRGTLGPNRYGPDPLANN